MLTEKVLDLLREDPVKNSNILGFARYNCVTEVQIAGNSVLLKGVSDRSWVYISSSCESELRSLMAYLSPEDTCFAVIDDWMMPTLTAGLEVKWCLSTQKLVMPGDHILTVTPASKEVCELSPDDAEYIFDNYDYQEYTSVAYIRERLQKGPSASIYVDGKPVAWTLTHDDEAIGLLKVLEPYRGKGYALAVTSHVVKSIRAQGNVPFVHIEEDNPQSLGLAKKMGFVSKGLTHWFEVYNAD